jgi:hypothetical protein
MRENGCNNDINAEADRRAFLKTAGKFASVVPPAMTLILSTTMNSSAIAQSVQHGNNGVGNGEDPQPPGNPPINDPAGSGPGNPAARTRNR